MKFCILTLVPALFAASPALAYTDPVPSASLTWDSAIAGMSIVRHYFFGTSQNKIARPPQTGPGDIAITSIADLTTAGFQAYAVAGTQTINWEQELYQPFNTTNFVFTQNSLNLVATKNPGPLPNGLPTPTTYYTNTHPIDMHPSSYSLSGRCLTIINDEPGSLGRQWANINAGDVFYYQGITNAPQIETLGGTDSGACGTATGTGVAHTSGINGTYNLSLTPAGTSSGNYMAATNSLQGTVFSGQIWTSSTDPGVSNTSLRYQPGVTQLNGVTQYAYAFDAQFDFPYQMPGAWPAEWLYSANYAPNYYHNSSEIDIMESFGQSYSGTGHVATGYISSETVDQNQHGGSIGYDSTSGGTITNADGNTRTTCGPTWSIYLKGSLSQNLILQCPAGTTFTSLYIGNYLTMNGYTATFQIVGGATLTIAANASETVAYSGSSWSVLNGTQSTILYDIRTGGSQFTPGYDFGKGATQPHHYRTLWTQDRVYKFIDQQLIWCEYFGWSSGRQAQYGLNLATGSDSWTAGFTNLRPNSPASFPLTMSIYDVKIWGSP